MLLQCIEHVEGFHELSHGFVFLIEGRILNVHICVKDHGRLRVCIEDDPFGHVAAIGVAGLGEVGPCEDGLMHEGVPCGIVLLVAWFADEIEPGLGVDTAKDEWQFTPMWGAAILTGLLR